MKKRSRLIIMVLCLISIFVCGFRYYDLNNDLPNKVKIIMYKQGEKIPIDGAMVSIHSETSTKPYNNQSQITDELNKYTYLKIKMIVENKGNVSIRPFEFINHDNIRNGNMLRSPEIQKKREDFEIPPGKNQTFTMYYAVEKENVKYGIYYLLPQSFTKKANEFSEKERNENLFTRKEVVLIDSK